MGRLLFLSFSLVVAMTGVALAESESFKKPWFCHGLDCPRYTVVKKTAQYEERTYEAAKWVSTKIKGSEFLIAQRTGFKRLFNYISGNNEDRKKVPMTTPVRSFIQPGDGPFCSTDFTVSFFVPFDYIEKTPKPTRKDVFIEENPEMTVFVAQFDGWMKEMDIKNKARALIEQLEKEGIAVKTSTYYAAGYDSPFRLIGRHNEVWIVKAEANSLPA